MTEKDMHIFMFAGSIGLLVTGKLMFMCIGGLLCKYSVDKLWGKRKK